MKLAAECIGSSLQLMLVTAKAIDTGSKGASIVAGIQVQLVHAAAPEDAQEDMSAFKLSHEAICK